MLLAAPLGTQDMAEIIPVSESSSIGRDERVLSLLWWFCCGSGAWREAEEAGGEGERERVLERRWWLCRPRKSGGGLGFRWVGWPGPCVRTRRVCSAARERRKERGSKLGWPADTYCR
jgi:hypothetical protein